MPAAAVIPAPVAYTNIAAVETFVVGLWALVCQAAGWPWRRPGSPMAHDWVAGTQPLAVWSSARTQMVLISSCVKSPSVGIETVGAPHTCLDTSGGVALGAAQPPPVHHRSLPSQSPWKTQCAQSNQNWLNAPPWNVTVSTECGKRVVLALVPISGNTVLSPGGSWALRALSGPGVSQPAGGGSI